MGVYRLAQFFGRGGGWCSMAMTPSQMFLRLCMTVIGIGYLFPISAIWAAFDYWKLIFPNSNIEFEVSCVFQVGSVVTVAFLSFSPTFSWGPRIYGGFSGQFVCL